MFCVEAVNPPGPVHAYVVIPAVPLHVVVFPEHIVCATGLGVTVGTGLTVIITFIGVPGQPPAVELIV